MRARSRGCLARGRAWLTRATAVVVVFSFSTACAVRSWHSVAIAPESVRRLDLPGQMVRIPTTGGLVTLRVARLAYPLVEGVPEPGSGEVAFPIERATAEVRTRTPEGWVFVTLPPEARGLVPVDLADRDVQFRTPEGTRLALHVRALEEGLVRGEPIACWGDADPRCTAPIVIDLREAAWIDVRGMAWGGVAGNLALVGLMALVWASFAALEQFDIE